MAHWIKNIFRTLYRFVIIWSIQSLSVTLIALILPGVYITGTQSIEIAWVAISVALVLSIVNILIRPIILLLAFSLGVVVLLIVGFILNALTLLLVSWLIPQFHVEGFLTAFVAALALAAVDTLLTGFIHLDPEESFFSNLVERLSRRQPFEDEHPDRNGLVMLEIDGLSYWHIQKAIASGVMPTVTKMLKDGEYTLSRVDCGLPSQTSACQSGIMFGDNNDIPAFRWYEKERGKLMVSSKDATEINARYSKGSGLMRGGSSINNMMAGDALISNLTLATMRTGDAEEKKRRAKDLYLLLLDPYFLMRVLALFLWDALVEVWQGYQQRRKNVQPRLNRLAHFYPFLRAATTVLMRDIPVFLAGLDIARGTPALYTTYPGYDEVAHHSGPWTSDAFGTLRQYDRVISNVKRLIERKAPRPYELVILSDHGQSFGATFKQRYGYDLKTFIEQYLTPGTSISGTSSGDTGGLTVGAMVDELDNVQDVHVGNRAGRATLRQTRRALESTLPADAELFEEGSKVVVCGSGNLAQVYFDMHTGKVTISDLNSAHPGLVDALVQHEGVGFVVGYDDDLEPIVLGKQGARNLHTGDITGQDPLTNYGDVTLRAAQLRRIADFPNNGDLTVISTVYPDGTVAAMEELIGNHGGMGGEQTDAFILHPRGWDIPETTNSADVFHILNKRRELPAKPKPQAAPVEAVSSWSWSTFRKGFADGRTWISRIAGALFMNRAIYQEISKDPYATGPALLIFLSATLLGSLVYNFNTQQPVNLWSEIISRMVAFLVLVILYFGAARFLGGKGSFTSTFRVLGYANSSGLLLLLGFIPGLGPAALFVTALSYLFAGWIGAAQANQLKGWRALVMPIAAGAILAIAVTALIMLGGATRFLAQDLLARFGFSGG